MYLNLETPVLDDINEFMEVDQRSAAQQSQSHCCKRGFRKSENGTNFTVTKPKRLSDEFNAGDDDIHTDKQLVSVWHRIHITFMIFIIFFSLLPFCYETVQEFY